MFSTARIAQGSVRMSAATIQIPYAKEKDAQTDSAFSDLCQRFGTFRLAFRIRTSRPIPGRRPEVHPLPQRELGYADTHHLPDQAWREGRWAHSRLPILSRRQCLTLERSDHQAGCRVWSQIQEPFVGSGAECVLSHLSRIERPCSVALGGQPARNARSCLHRLPPTAFANAESAEPADPGPSLR